MGQVEVTRDNGMDMHKPLAGHAAVVTGCGSEEGLGRAISRALAEAGAAVAVTDLLPRQTDVPHASSQRSNGWRGLASLVEEIEVEGGKAVAISGDVSSFSDVERMVGDAIESLGKIDILVNNAAAPHGEDRTWSWQVPEHAFDQVMRVNCKGVFLCSTAVIRHLKERDSPGRIINISSSAGRQGFPQRAAYSASKFAVLGLTQSMAQELAKSAITVNAVCPGPTATARQTATAARLLSGDEEPNTRFTVTTTPTGRLGRPDDVARVVVFLAEPAAEHITGQAINVDGGFIMS